MERRMHSPVMSNTLCIARRRTATNWWNQNHCANASWPSRTTQPWHPIPVWTGCIARCERHITDLWWWQTFTRPSRSEQLVLRTAWPDGETTRPWRWSLQRSPLRNSPSKSSGPCRPPRKAQAASWSSPTASPSSLSVQPYKELRPCQWRQQSSTRGCPPTGLRSV